MKRFTVVVTMVLAVMVMAVVLRGSAAANAHVPPTMFDVCVSEASDSKQSQSPLYKIQGSYAQIQGAATGSIQDKANHAIQDVVNEEIQSFKSCEAERVADLAASGEKYKGTPYADATSELDISSTVGVATLDVLSLRLTFFYCHAGAAHGMTVARVVNYDLAHGVLLTRASLFKNELDALKTISTYARAELDKKLVTSDDERAWIADGTDPAEAENLQNLVLTPKGLLVAFDPYEVDCYAAGPQEVLIPLSIIKPFLAVSITG